MRIARGTDSRIALRPLSSSGSRERTSSPRLDSLRLPLPSRRTLRAPPTTRTRIRISHRTTPIPTPTSLSVSRVAPTITTTPTSETTMTRTLFSLELNSGVLVAYSSSILFQQRQQHQQAFFRSTERRLRLAKQQQRDSVRWKQFFRPTIVRIFSSGQPARAD